MSQAGERRSHQSQQSVARTGPLTPLSDMPALLATRQHPDILPQHETDYPATDAVKAAIAADWDGSGPSAHDLGSRFRSPVKGHPYPAYPGWRIEAIAWQVGIYDERRAALARQAGQEERAGSTEKARKGGKARQAAQVSRAVSDAGASWREPTGLFARQDTRDTADAALADLERAGRAHLSRTFGDQPAIGLTPVRSLGAALARVDAQLAAGDGDANTLALLTIEREVLADLAAERTTHGMMPVAPAAAAAPVAAPQNGEEVEEPMTMTIPVVFAVATDDTTPETAAETVAEAHEPPHVNDRRPATCAQCGQSFSSLYRGGKQGWSRFCSSACGGTARWQGVKRSGERQYKPDPARSAPKPIKAAPAVIHVRLDAPMSSTVAAAISQTPSEAVAVVADAATPRPTPITLPAPIPAPPPAPPHDTDHWRAVTLASGGIVTVSVKGNILAFTRTERALLFTLIERLEQYEAEQAKQEAE